MAIEVELRTFISKEKFDELLEFFNQKAEFVHGDYQESYYFNSDQDLRIQRNNFFSKIWMKGGKIHDSFREETEIKFPRDKFGQLVTLFLKLGYGIDAKWLRKRYIFNWQGVKVCLDDTKGYGYILELEKLADENNKDMALEILKQKLKSLKLSLTPREEFDRKFQNYRENWKTLIN